MIAILILIAALRALFILILILIAHPMGRK
jgi:hypothetical protein